VTVRGPRSSHRGERGGHVHREAGVERLPDDPEHGIAEPVALVLDHERVAVLVVEQDPLDEQAPGGFGAGQAGQPPVQGLWMNFATCSSMASSATTSTPLRLRGCGARPGPSPSCL
jgi:hypothetical protein